jgi:hypothetical protein
LIALQNNLQKDTCVKVGGNHFIFVEQEQAKRSVDPITKALDNVGRIDKALRDIFSETN